MRALEIAMRPRPSASAQSGFDLPIVEGVEDLRVRAAVIFLGSGGLMSMTAATLPNYLQRGLWPHLLLLAVGFSVAVSAFVVARWGLPAAFVLPLAVGGDGSVFLATLVVSDPADTITSVAALGVLCVFVAVFGRGRDLIVQTILSNITLAAVAPHALQHWASMLMFMFGSNFGLVLPSFAMYALRQRLVATTQFAHRLARTDPLTGSFNRRGLTDQASAILGLVVARGHGLGALVCDLDQFKVLNDTYGHASGDEALVAVGEILLHSVRAEDVVVRLGGEEFAVVAAIAAPELFALAERIRSDVESGCSRWGLTVSIGASWLAPPCHLDDDADLIVWSLLAAADQETYRAKASGRNRVEHPYMSSTR
jgi:diguanylate cyclase (GGDEF)-like protein